MTDTAASVTTKRHSFAPVQDSGFDVVLPDFVHDVLFGKPDTKTDAIPPCYALLDGGRTPFLEERIEGQGLKAVCLFNNDQGDIDLKDAPWVIEMRADAALTLDLFSHTDLPMCLWPARPGVLFRSDATLAALRAHFRKFTYLPNEAGERVLFRFWEPYVVYGLASVAPHTCQQIFAQISRILCPLDRRSLGDITLQDVAPQTQTLTLDDTLRSQLSFLRGKNTLVEIAERLWARAPKDDADWPAFRNETVGRGEAWISAYGLTTRKYIETLLMYHNELPEMFTTQKVLDETDAILRAQGTQGERMEQLTRYLRAQNT